MRDASEGEFQKLCDVLYRRSCQQHVRMRSSLSVTHAFSAAVPTRISERRTVRVSSTLPEKSDKAGVPGCRSGKDYSTRGPSLSDASAANAAESQPCVGVTRIGSEVVDGRNSLEHGRRGRTDGFLRQPDGRGPVVQFTFASSVECFGSRRSPSSDVGRVLHQLCKASLCAEPSVTRYLAEQYERAAELGR